MTQLIAFLAIGLALLASAVAPVALLIALLGPCAVEDDTNCYWVAGANGSHFVSVGPASLLVGASLKNPENVVALEAR